MHQSAFRALAEVSGGDAQRDTQRLLTMLEAERELAPLNAVDIAVATTIWRAAFTFSALIQAGVRFEQPDSENAAVMENQLLTQYGDARSAIVPVIEAGKEDVPVDFADIHILSHDASQNLANQLAQIMSEMREMGYSEARIRSTLGAKGVPRWLLQEFGRQNPAPWRHAQHGFVESCQMGSRHNSCAPARPQVRVRVS